MALFIKGGGGRISVTSSGPCKIFSRYQIAGMSYISVDQRILYLEHRETTAEMFWVFFPIFPSLFLFSHPLFSFSVNFGGSDKMKQGSSLISH